MKKPIIFLEIIFLLFACISSKAQTIINVPADYLTISEAVAAANSGDEIVIAPGTYLESAINIDKDLTIRGDESSSTIIDANQSDIWIFRIQSGNVDISWLTLTGINGSDHWYRSAVYNSGGNVSVSNCLITNNTGTYGVGILQDGTACNLTVTNTTISGNNAPSLGTAGIYVYEGDANIMNTTITDNTAVGPATAGGLTCRSTATITNCLIYGNTGGFTNNIRVLGGATVNLGSDLNIIETVHVSGTGTLNGTYLTDDPGLQTLANNGGPTMSHAILSGSPAIDAGTTTGAPIIDQTGANRIGNPDLGAMEVDLIAPVAIVKNVVLPLDENGEAVVTVSDVDNGSYDNVGIEMMELVGQTAFTCTDICSLESTVTDQGEFGQYGLLYAYDVAQSFTVGQNGLLSKVGLRFDNNTDADLSFIFEIAEGTDPNADALISQTVTIVPNYAAYTEIDLDLPIFVTVGEEYTVRALGLTAYAGDIEARGTVDIDYAGGDFWKNTGSGWEVAGSGSNDMWFVTKVSQSNSTTVDLSVTDFAGNTAVATAIVFIADNTKPTFTCVDNQVITLNEGEITYTVAGTEFDPTDTDDNCNVASVENNINNSATLSGEELPVGTTEIVWTVTDKSGNEGTCTYTVTVNAYTEINNLLKYISIYPNPVSDIVTVNISDFLTNSNVKVEILDITGKVIYKSHLLQSNSEIDLSSHCSGVYFLKIQTDKEIFTIKIVKE